MTIFEQVVDYVAEFDPKYPEAIVGATPQQITELQELVGGELPAVYEDFLRLMGANMDWIRVAELDLSIETVLEHYRKEKWPPATEYIRIGADEAELRFDPYLDVALFHPEPPVVGIPPCREPDFASIAARSAEPLAGSLQELVALPAFQVFELRKDGRVPALLRSDKWERDIMKAVKDAISSLEFEQLWFSSKTGHAYRRGDAAIRANQFTGRPLQIFVSADEDGKRDVLAEELTKLLPNLRRVA